MHLVLIGDRFIIQMGIPIFERESGDQCPVGV